VKTNQRRSRIRNVIVMTALVLACGTISVAADSSRSKGAEAEGRHPVAPVSGFAQPTTDAASPEPRADSGSPEPTAAAGSPEPTKESDSAEPTANAGSASSDALPVGDLPGWTQVFAEDFTEQGCGLLLNFRHGHEYTAGAKQQRVLLLTGPLATALTPLVARRDGPWLRQALLRWLLPGLQQRWLRSDVHGSGKRHSKFA
jgi:hypothetical protein